MPSGKYFFIKSKLNGLVLDVTGESREPGTKVITWHQKDPDQAENQLWYEDHIHGTINSKQSGLCLEVDDDNNELTINTYSSGKSCQQWMTSGDRVQNREDNDKVLDIAAANTSTGARVCAWGCHGGDNQQWEFVYLPAKFFYIKSAMHGKVLDIKKRKPDAGTKAIMMDQDDEVLDNQLWYEDKHGIICSKLNDYVLDASNDDKIRLQPFEPGNAKQLWTISGEKIVNRSDPSQALDIKGAQTKNGAKLLSYEWHGNDNQRWIIVYQ